MSRAILPAPGVNAAVREQRSEPVAMRVPGRVRRGRPSSLRKFCRELQPAIPVGGQRAGRAAELKLQRLVERRATAFASSDEPRRTSLRPCSRT